MPNYYSSKLEGRHQILSQHGPIWSGTEMLEVETNKSESREDAFHLELGELLRYRLGLGVVLKVAENDHALPLRELIAMQQYNFLGIQVSFTVQCQYSWETYFQIFRILECCK
jgi:hypothetical protein